jgi:hypothetical protein
MQATVTKQQVLLKIDPELARQLRIAKAETRQNLSAIVEAALLAYLPTLSTPVKSNKRTTRKRS